MFDSPKSALQTKKLTFSPSAEEYPLHASMHCNLLHLMTSEGGVAHILAYTLATSQNVARKL
jgi:hypothetical protein